MIYNSREDEQRIALMAAIIFALNRSDWEVDESINRAEVIEREVKRRSREENR